ncbi:MAG: dTDP-4-dehydrorhamnose 3,5-epimerase family protein [Deltaproteobacteria bacterium]|nr:dTDP-4-dehydrorhamnose 3,5-epimerase family protein [Deltaproteobacteria bacterium]
MIEGVIVRSLAKHSDSRGWLSEFFRADELDASLMPVMSYMSMTKPGVARGPHEHIHQTDLFCFVGPSTFKIYLWDNRKGSKTHGEKMTLTAGEGEPKAVIVPPGVVHAYKNVGTMDGLAFNGPNKLYKGPGKTEDVDEIRHEDIKDSPYLLD